LTGAVAIRAATRDDVPLVNSLVVELAEYERAPEQVTGTEELLARALFGSPAHAEAVIAELDGEPVGFALYFGTFSTWLCLPGLWLEDLYVRPASRRSGVGRALFAHVAAIAIERGCGRLEWTVLDWNTPAISFYESLGAETMRAWDTLRLSGDALARVAATVGDGP
jgi:GNAT superfamily N-acetyltransferase